MNQIDPIDLKTKERLFALAKKLNPSAKVGEAKYSKIDVEEMINTNIFTFEKAATGAGWLKSLLEFTMRETNGTSMIVLSRRPRSTLFCKEPERLCWLGVGMVSQASCIVPGSRSIQKDFLTLLMINSSRFRMSIKSRTRLMGMMKVPMRRWQSRTALLTMTNLGIPDAEVEDNELAAKGFQKDIPPR